MRTYPSGETVDVVVIGTGAGGAPVLARLAQAGFSVVALEAGRWWSPTTEYAQDEVAQAPLYWLDERLSAGDDPTAFGSNNSGCGVGGSTLHYGAYAPRPDPRDLTLRTEFGVSHDCLSLMRNCCRTCRKWSASSACLDQNAIRGTLGEPIPCLPLRSMALHS